MVEEIATVVSVDSGGVWLSTTPVASCNACNVSDDCGTGIVAKTMTPRQQRFFVSTSLALLPGEQVKIGMQEHNLIMAAIMVYLLPLLLLLTGAVLAGLAGLAEGWVILAAVAGVTAGFILARRYGRMQQSTEHISILEVLPQLALQRLI